MKPGAGRGREKSFTGERSCRLVAWRTIMFTLRWVRDFFLPQAGEQSLALRRIHPFAKLSLSYRVVPPAGTL